MEFRLNIMRITEDKILFFDLDGTLIDTDYLNWISYRETCKYFDNIKEVSICFRPYKILNGVWSRSFFPDKKEYHQFLEKFDINKRINSSYFNISPSKDKFICKKDEFYNKKLYFSKKIPENVAILKQFSKTNKIILVSNCRKERGLETLKYHKLDDYFYKMFFEEDKTLSDNKYENAIKYLNISIDNVIAFEDDDREIENAKKVGIRDINVDIDVSLKDVINNVFDKSTEQVLFYQNNDTKIRIEIDKEVLDYLLKDREDNIYIDETKCFSSDIEGEILQKYKILKGGLKEFIIEPNQFLKKEIKAFYHKEYFSRGNWKIEGTVEYMIWSLKNDGGCKIEHQNYLSTAFKRLKIILQRDLPKIKDKINVDSLAVCIVPRAKEGFLYREDQLLFRKAVSDVVDKLKNDLSLINGTKYLVRHTSTKTTHLKPDDGGILPYIGITKDTCYISDNVIGKDILLVDDIYTKTVNIDEDAIQSLLDKGANSVHFYAIGKTYSYK